MENRLSATESITVVVFPTDSASPVSGSLPFALAVPGAQSFEVNGQGADNVKVRTYSYLLKHCYAYNQSLIDSSPE